MNLEDELRAALRRQDPPLGFAQRVLQRTESRQRRLRTWWTAAIAAALIMAIAIPMEYRRAQAERAGREAVLALRIAAEKLNHARSKVLKYETEN